MLSVTFQALKPESFAFYFMQIASFDTLRPTQFPVFCYCFTSKWQNFMRQWMNLWVTSADFHWLTIKLFHQKTVGPIMAACLRQIYFRAEQLLCWLPCLMKQIAIVTPHTQLFICLFLKCFALWNSLIFILSWFFICRYVFYLNARRWFMLWKHAIEDMV